jgi:hypothetical protein
LTLSGENQTWIQKELGQQIGPEDLPMRWRKERLMKRFAAQLKLLQKAKALPRISAG